MNNLLACALIRSRWFGALTLVLLCVGMCAPLFAQTAGTASVQGTISDPTGAVIGNAAITLTLTETGTSRSTVSDSSGIFSLPNVPVGPYSLSVAATGFQGYTQRGVLEVGNNLQVNAALTVGKSSDHVDVQAQGVALETETSSFKQVIDQARITELPLNGRQATQLILISGGAVTAPTGDIIGSKNYFSSTVIAVAGGQGNYNNYVLDGGNHVDSFTNVNLPYPFPDALREFSVESNSLPARNGLHPGALVNVVTNSGTNRWHGTVFEFLRNNIINSNNFFSTAKDTLKRNQFGGTLGGKILTDKMFFFVGYQGTRNRQVGNATSSCIPSAAELTGDFNQQGGNCPLVANWGVAGTNAQGQPTPAPILVDPVTGADISATRKVPQSSFNQVALNLIKYLPIGQADKFGRINVALPANSSEDQYIGRIDYTFNDKHSLFGRYFIAQYQQPNYYSPTNLLLTTTAGNDERGQAFTLGDTYILSPRLVNTFHGTYTRRRDTRGPTAGGINATTLGANLFVYTSVDLRLTVANNFAVGCGTCAPGYFNVNTEAFADDVDYVRGKHQLAFGGEIIRTGDNTQTGYLYNGNYNFGGQLSGAKNKNVGEPMIDFLTGQMNAFSQSRAQQTTFRQTIFSIYAQDTYHATPHLTMNIGLRWEPNLYQTDKFGRGSSFSRAAFDANLHSSVYPLAPAGSTFYGDPGVPKSFTDNRLSNLSPRVGLTYDPFGSGKTVFRFGGAIMYDSPPLYASQRLTSNPPYTNEIDLNGQIPLSSPWTGYPGGDPFPGTFPPNASAVFPTNTLYVLIPRHIQTPAVNQWTASVQQDLGMGWNMSINYLGNKNSHLWLGQGPNAAVYIPGTYTGAGSCGAMVGTPGVNGFPAIGGACSSTANTNLRTPLSLANSVQGQFYSATMTQISDGNNSSYHGIIAAVQHRMSHDFSFLANYTWSHCISVGDAPGDIAAPVFENPSNPRLDRANCGYDVRHIFNTTLVASSHFKSLHGITGALVNDWQIAPLVRILSGAVLNLTSGVDNSLNGIGLDRPNLISGSAIYTGTKVTQSATNGNRFYLNKTAFAQNAAGTFGNLGRNALRQPNYYDVDMAISRRFPIHEQLGLNIRIEAFNVLNHPNFNGYTTALNSSTFGYATSAQDPRIFQIAAKFTF
ncbi:TonB-dependent receptor [Terriglobus saanensis SP1PR4]|uniref:TonB-dependent receptor n=1 Tax=Terriglobus saanensis (strain ATCC BAA-1853 / DSM 23119 / SP1PR4) TaxID=401053 RepID=E8V7Z2_TERSS|nr:TonB-dependent receptor [Terriglobus saanensis SP1PR4]